MTAQRSVLGIDLRVTSVKVVEVEKGKDKPVIKNWGLAEIPYFLIDKHPQKEDAQAETLRKLIKSKKIETKEAVVVVGGSDVFIKIFTLAEISKAEVVEVIKWKFAEEIPFPVEDALVDFYPLTGAQHGVNEKVDYVAACVHKNTFREIEQIIRKAGLKLLAIAILPDALQKVFSSEMQKDNKKIVSLIYMGKRTTNISILKDGNLEFNRELSIGGENITLAMSGVLVSSEGRVEINPEEAEKIKVEHGVPVMVEGYPQLEDIPISQLQAMVRPALERIQDEIVRTFEYYKGQTGEAAVDKVILTGGSAMTKNLANFLAEGLGIPVVAGNVLESFALDEKLDDRAALESVIPRLSAAIGATLVGDERINLEPEEVKHHWKVVAQRVLKPQYLASLYIGFITLFYAIFWFQAYNLKNEVSDIERKLDVLKPRLATLDVIEQTAQEAEKKRFLMESYKAKRTRMPKVFVELSRLVPQSIYINVLNMTPTEVHLWGTVFEKGDTPENILSRFVLSLSASEYFSNVKLIQANKGYDYIQDSFNFEIVAEMGM
ncbi:MAG: type IV pilus assembly protein PilM [Candidatus Margulisbacteria bacterium]|nr:type IV pilus assembly protein PilM [Candidatus Margulisiibacteriota bacterium]